METVIRDDRHTFLRFVDVANDVLLVFLGLFPRVPP